MDRRRTWAIRIARWGASALGGAALLAGCSTPVAPSYEPGGATQASAVVQGWIGRYTGAGGGQVDGQAFTQTDADLTIAFDADSVALPECTMCVTVTFDPWFSRANLRLDRAADAYLIYEVQGVTRSLAINRFSGAGGTANILLVRAERWQGSGATAVLTAWGDFQLDLR